MGDIIAKCGCNCSRCSTYKDNLATPGDRQLCSDGWKKYFGIRLSPEKLRACDGCQLPDKERKVYYLNCIARKCAIWNGIENCANCSDYPCDEVMGVHDVQKPGARDRIAARIGAPVPEEDYLRFIEPYEGIKHLNEIRSALKPEKIREVKLVSYKPRIVDFPAELPSSAKGTQALRSLHKLLAALNAPVEGISFARREVLKKRRPLLFRLLWTFGLFGRLQQDTDTSHLTIDSKVYYRQKNLSTYARVKHHFEILEECGVHCDIIPLVEKEWLTPGGGLRAKVGRNQDPAWIMTIRFDERAGGAPALSELGAYAQALNELIGAKDFGLFAAADMRGVIG
jgi:hypothetical protein